MTELNNEQTPVDNGRAEINDTDFDSASKSLSDALKVSFGILKFIMIVLVVFFLCSGLNTIESDEMALVLSFGKIRGVGEERVLKPGFHWTWPLIEEVVRVPVEKKIDMNIDSFWYYQHPSELLTGGQVRVPRTLKPEIDGYCIVRNASQGMSVSEDGGSDYNIVHTNWQMTYQIDDPERFFRNVYVDQVKSGDIYLDVIKKGVTPLLKNCFEDAVVTVMTRYTIDDALYSDSKVISHVERLLQKQLDDMESGVLVDSIQLTNATWPRQVDKAFQESIAASQFSQKSISEARTYQQNTVNAAEGQAQKVISEARAFKRQFVESARSNAEYLEKILPEYRKYPKLVIQRIYQDAIMQVMDNVEEKMVVQSTEGGENTEIRVNINRDPSIKTKERQ
jgi:HflK protein